MLYFLAIISGVLIGLSVGAGAALMFRAPKQQGLGAFRTLGEINGSNGDPLSHFGFGLGFFVSSIAASAATGALTQDVHHRVLPNWASAIVTWGGKNQKDKMKMIKSPSRMGVAGAILGAIIVPILVGIPDAIPQEITDIAKGILTPAATWLFKYVMPVLFLLAAIGAGLKVGLASILLATLFQFTSGNALPGIVLGIILGSIWDQKGAKSTHFIVMAIIIISMWVLIAYFRDLFTSKVDVWLSFKKI